jgi:hypothetical protein
LSINQSQSSANFPTLYWLKVVRFWNHNCRKSLVTTHLTHFFGSCPCDAIRVVLLLLHLIYQWCGMYGIGGCYIVRDGRNLVNMDIVGKSDPYVKVELIDGKDGIRRRFTFLHNHTAVLRHSFISANSCETIGTTILATRTSAAIKDNLNPVWNFVADFNDVITTTATNANNRVRINVWDQDIGRDEFLYDPFRLPSEIANLITDRPMNMYNSGGYTFELPSTAAKSKEFSYSLTGNTKSSNNGTITGTLTWSPS